MNEALLHAFDAILNENLVNKLTSVPSGREWFYYTTKHALSCDNDECILNKSTQNKESIVKQMSKS